ncbi:MAG TPA: hypothetical protein VF660_08130 [Actinomycetota bacterium]
MDVRVSMRQQEDGRWVAAIAEGEPVPSVLAKGPSKEECLARLRRALERSLTEGQQDGTPALLVELVPRLAGVAEAAQIIGWDKRRVITYIDRGRFPEPLQSLASGRVWSRASIEEFARAWHARQSRRRRVVRASEPDPSEPDPSEHGAP